MGETYSKHAEPEMNTLAVHRCRVVSTLASYQGVPVFESLRRDLFS
jgi:hypothetical protein